MATKKSQTKGAVKKGTSAKRKTGVKAGRSGVGGVGSRTAQSSGGARCGISYQCGCDDM